MRSWQWVVVAGVVACGAGETAAPAQDPGKEPAKAAAAPAGKREDVTIAAFIPQHAAGVQLVDVRTDEEWAAGHVPGAVHVPLADLKKDHPAMAAFDATKPVYFICAAGGRSAKAADQMSAAGLHAINVAGGTNGWRDAGQKVDMPGATP
jgi:rhodanese-related sulfurtransferase